MKKQLYIKDKNIFKREYFY